VPLWNASKGVSVRNTNTNVSVQTASDDVKCTSLKAMHLRRVSKTAI
jgi:hypothetical protein